MVSAETEETIPKLRMAMSPTTAITEALKSSCFLVLET